MAKERKSVKLHQYFILSLFHSFTYDDDWNAAR